LAPPSSYTYESIRSMCTALGDGWDLVSIQSVAHIEWLRDQAGSSGVGLAVPSGVPLAYDPQNSGTTYYDLTNPGRDVTPIFDALRLEGWPGDYHTNQRNDCGGQGQPFAGFGWRSMPRPGIEDWGVCHGHNRVLCERTPPPPPPPPLSLADWLESMTVSHPGKTLLTAVKSDASALTGGEYTTLRTYIGNGALDEPLCTGCSFASVSTLGQFPYSAGTVLAVAQGSVNQPSIGVGGQLSPDIRVSGGGAAWANGIYRWEGNVPRWRCLDCTISCLLAASDQARWGMEIGCADPTGSTMGISGAAGLYGSGPDFSGPGASPGGCSDDNDPTTCTMGKRPNSPVDFSPLPIPTLSLASSAVSSVTVSAPC